MINIDFQPEGASGELGGIPLTRSVRIFPKRIKWGSWRKIPSLVWAVPYIKYFGRKINVTRLLAFVCNRMSVALAAVIFTSAVLHWHRIPAPLAFELNRRIVTQLPRPSAADWNCQGIQFCGLSINCVLSISSMQTSNVGLLSSYSVNQSCDSLFIYTIYQLFL